MPGSWDNPWGFTYKLVHNHAPRLISGIYTCSRSMEGNIYFSQCARTGDEVLDLPGLPNKFILDQIDKFWQAKDVYDKYNFIHKRGVLLYGPSGNGKTCIISALTDHLIKQDGVAIIVTQFDVAVQALAEFRIAEPDRKLMTIIEDMESLLSGDNKLQEQKALSMLDGQTQVSNIVHIGTTNYPEQLADRFIKRPGRFDLVIGVGLPTAETRRAYLKHLFGEHDSITYIVNQTEGMSLAYLREIASSYICLGIDIEERVKELRTALKSKVKINNSSVGFKIGYEEEMHQVVLEGVK
jgi:SpoVK/Ycf46/Vps4 family AAA+-type ATPase